MKTQEQIYETELAPRPWNIVHREYERLDKKGHRAGKRMAWFLVDANGNDVRRTFSNMRFICDCVNKADNQ